MAQVPGHKWMESFRKLLNVQTNCLKYSGLWTIDPKLSQFTRTIYAVYSVWTITTMHIFAITLLADIYSNIDNLSITTDDGCIFAGILVVIFKAMNYQLRGAKIARLFDGMLECGDDLSEFSEVEYVKDIIEWNQIRSTVIFRGFSVLGCVLGIALLFFSPMQDGLPIRAKYPFDTTVSPWHEIALTVEICVVSIGLMAIIAMDSTMTTLCSLLTVLFDVLSVNFENCTGKAEIDTEHRDDYGTNSRRDTKEQNSRFLNRYKKCLVFHQRLVSMANTYNRIYNSSMFVQMLSSTSMICLTGFQAVVVGGQSSDVMKFGIYLSAATTQLLYYCWIGNELSYASSVLDRSQWLSGWHHVRLTSIAQMFTLSTMFSRQPISLKAGAFYALSLETFIAIIRRSYSVFTLLNNMHSTDP